MSDKPATLTAHLIAWPLGIACSLWCAYVLTWWWLWFVVPLGVPAIGTLHAWALSAGALFFHRHLSLAVAERCGERLDSCKTSQYVIVKPIAIAIAMTGVWGVFWCVQRLM